VPPAPRPANALGIYRMALRTDDIEADVAALAAEGIECFAPPATLDMGPGLPPVTFVCFPDPDGATVELVSGGR